MQVLLLVRSSDPVSKILCNITSLSEHLQLDPKASMSFNNLQRILCKINVTVLGNQLQDVWDIKTLIAEVSIVQVMLNTHNNTFQYNRGLTCMCMCVSICVYSTCIHMVHTRAHTHMHTHTHTNMHGMHHHCPSPLLFYSKLTDLSVDTTICQRNNVQLKYFHEIFSYFKIADT